jgi:hypothetical protein
MIDFQCLVLLLPSILGVNLRKSGKSYSISQKAVYKKRSIRIFEAPFEYKKV